MTPSSWQASIEIIDKNTSIAYVAAIVGAALEDSHITATLSGDAAMTIFSSREGIAIILFLNTGSSLSNLFTAYPNK